ncbi:MAG: Serine-protein kinase RsbW [Eubacteriales bacterium SKADARSKE-1]|nr:Serine-protein kinase RsbW [Eubacteriales bacterium SKADARSKE-1]
MKELTFIASCSNIPLAVNFVNKFLSENNIGQVDKFDIVIEEILSNISNYAYKNTESNITLICDYNKPLNEIILTFKDSGFSFNPIKAKVPDITIPIEDRSIGGLGLLIVKNIVDDMQYARQNGENILTIKKKIS